MSERSVVRDEGRLSAPTVAEEAKRLGLPIELSKRQAVAFLRGRVGLILCVVLRCTPVPVLIALDLTGVRLSPATHSTLEDNLDLFRAAVVVFQAWCIIRIGVASGRRLGTIILWVILGSVDIIGVIMAGGLAAFAGNALASHRLKSGWMGISQDAIDARWPAE